MVIAPILATLTILTTFMIIMIIIKTTNKKIIKSREYSIALRMQVITTILAIATTITTTLIFITALMTMIMIVTCENDNHFFIQ